MDPASLILDALATGAARGASEAATDAVSVQYAKLKRLLASWFSGKRSAEVALSEHAADPGIWRAPLEKELVATGASADESIIVAAQDLMALIDQAGAQAGRYQVDARGSHGVQIGDRNRQFNVYRDGGHRLMPYWEPLVRAFAWAKRFKEAYEYLGDIRRFLLSSSWERRSWRGSGGLGRSPRRVILLEQCDGVQVGRDNAQYSAFLVGLPRSVLQPSNDLAERLLRLDARRTRDVFSHRARLREGHSTNRFGFAPERFFWHPGEDTLVLIRRSRGVQVGEANVQRNEFRIWVDDFRVRADQAAFSIRRRELVAKLLADPRDRAAARGLAEDVARSAHATLVRDVTDRIRERTNPRRIKRAYRRFRNLTGRQIGGPGNRAREDVDVRVGRIDTDALTRKISAEAEHVRASRELARDRLPGRTVRGISSKGRERTRDDVTRSDRARRTGRGFR